MAARKLLCVVVLAMCLAAVLADKKGAAVVEAESDPAPPPPAGKLARKVAIVQDTVTGLTEAKLSSDPIGGITETLTDLKSAVTEKVNEKVAVFTG